MALFNNMADPLRGKGKNFEQRGTKLGGTSGFQRDTGAGAGFGLGRMVGGTLKGYDSEGQPIFDYSQSFDPKTKGDAVGQFDFSGMDQAISGFKNPTATYNPYQFNFSGDVNKLADEQYNLGSKSIQRQGAGGLEKLRETVGTRRPGLLGKLGDQNQRGILETLGGLRGNLNVNAMNQGLELNKAQQLAQASENMNSEKAKSDDIFRNLGALAETSGKKVGMESDVYERERANEMEKVKTFLDAYMQAKTSTPQKKSKLGGIIQSGIGAAAGIASKFI